MSADTLSGGKRRTAPVRLHELWANRAVQLLRLADDARWPLELWVAYDRGYGERASFVRGGPLAVIDLELELLTVDAYLSRVGYHSRGTWSIPIRAVVGELKHAALRIPCSSELRTLAWMDCDRWYGLYDLVGADVAQLAGAGAAEVFRAD